MLVCHGPARTKGSSIAALSVDRVAVYQTPAIGSMPLHHRLKRNQPVSHTSGWQGSNRVDSEESAAASKIDNHFNNISSSIL
jgi:hypothetical protein